MITRPGSGWTHIYGNVYEHTNGTRIHLGGLVKLPDGKIISANNWPESKSADKFIRINGGNRRRGLMTWAMAYNADTSQAL